MKYECFRAVTNTARLRRCMELTLVIVAACSSMKDLERPAEEDEKHDAALTNFSKIRRPILTPLALLTNRIPCGVSAEINFG